MKYCKYCGNRIDDDALFCSSCGARQGAEGTNNYNSSNNGEVPPVNLNFGVSDYDLNKRSKGITVLCAFFWWLGLVLWLMWKDTKPGLATSAAKGALINVSLGSPIVGLVLWIFWKDRNREFSKACGISAIIGAVILVLYLAFIIIIYANGLLPEVLAESGYELFVSGRVSL